MTTECFNQNCVYQDEYTNVCGINMKNCKHRKKEWSID